MNKKDVEIVYYKRGDWYYIRYPYKLLYIFTMYDYEEELKFSTSMAYLGKKHFKSKKECMAFLRNKNKGKDPKHKYNITFK